MSIWSPGREPRPVCSRRPGGRPRGADIRRQREDITGARRMPWHRKPMKDAASCDNPRLGAHTLRPAGLRMGEPAGRSSGIPLGNTYLGGGQPGELKHLSTRRRRNQHEIPRVAASGRGPWPNRRAHARGSVRAAGVVGPRRPGAAAPGAHRSRGAERHGTAGGTGLQPRRRTLGSGADAAPE